MTKVVAHSLLLVLTILTSFFLSKTSLKSFDFQIIALVFFIYVVAKKSSALGSSQHDHPYALLDSVVGTFIISTIINASGGLSSPFFFLNYFLLFTLSLLLEPAISITTTITLALLYLLTTPQNLPFKSYLPLFSLPFLTPFALFLGEEYRQLKLKTSELKLVRHHIKKVKELIDNYSHPEHVTEIKKTINEIDLEIQRYEKHQD